jgi:hypothetical protein
LVVDAILLLRCYVGEIINNELSCTSVATIVNSIVVNVSIPRYIFGEIISIEPW